MALQSHLYRRGAAYVWRRRWPALHGGRILQISLRTNEPLLARRLSAIVTAESNGIFDSMTSQGLSRADARKFLEHIILREQAKIAMLRADTRNKADAVSNHAHDWAMGTALKLFSQHGPGAVPLDPAEAESLRREGRSAHEINLVRHNLETQASLPRTAPDEGPGIVIKQQMTAALGRETFSAAEFIMGRNHYIQGRAAAYIQAARDDSLGFDAALDLAGQLAKGETIAAAPSYQAKAEAEALESYDPAWTALIERFAASKRKAEVSDLMIKQMTKVFLLFAEATGITDLRDIRQSHLARFIDILGEIPVHYRKSPKDAGKSLAQILKEAKGLHPDEVGLSPTTIHRNLGYLGQIFKKAASEGYGQLKLLDTDSLRPKKTVRARNARPSIKPDDITNLFRHPIWTGSGRGKSWDKPGTIIEGDGLYWLPLIGALSGARRAEIGGLAPDDIGDEDGTPFFWFRPNALRGVKALASERQIPIHPQLIELGLIDRVNEMRAQGGDMLFPDLRMADGNKIGDKIDYKFRRALNAQLPGGREDKSFHGLRHYINTHMTKRNVPVGLRKDILGHAGGDVNAETYTDTAEIGEMRPVIYTLPHIEGIKAPNSHDRSGFGDRPLHSQLGMLPYEGQFKKKEKPEETEK